VAERDRDMTSLCGENSEGKEEDRALPVVMW